MKKQLITTAIIIAISTAQTVSAEEIPVNVDEQSKKHAIYEKPTVIGFGSGVIAGAIIAGPVGAVVAGTIGLLIGNAEEVDEKHTFTKHSLKQSQQALDDAISNEQLLNEKLISAKHENTVLNQQLILANNTLEIADNLEKLKLNLQFNVNSSELESFYEEQVLHLAQLARNSPNLHIHLSGYADRNGDINKNLTLSEHRVNTVKALLVQHGINENNIITQALGENSPILTEQSLQNDFYDRRVEIQIVQPTVEDLASNTDISPTFTAGN